MINGTNASLIAACVQAAVSSCRKFLQHSDDVEEFEVDEYWEDSISKGNTILKQLNEKNLDVIHVLFKTVCEEIIAANSMLNDGIQPSNIGDDNDDDDEEE